MVLGSTWFQDLLRSPGEILVLGSNQDLLRSPGGILVLGSWFWFEPRFAQESWGNLGSWFLVLGFESWVSLKQMGLIQLP